MGSGRSKILKSVDGSCRWFGVIMDVTEQYASDNLIKEQRHDLDTILSVISPIIKLKISLSTILNYFNVAWN